MRHPHPARTRQTIDLPVAVARDIETSVEGGARTAFELIEHVDEPWLYRRVTNDVQ